MITHLETERLNLRQWRDTDFDWFSAILTDPVTAAYVGGVQQPRDAWRRMAAFAGHWALRGYGLFVMELKAAARGIGWCGLWYPPDFPDLELGWGLTKSHHGQGYATEAARRVLAHSYDDLGRSTLVSYVHPDNEPSRRLAARIGGRQEADAIIGGNRALVYRHSNPSQPAAISRPAAEI
jgi:RimJ/RimL family protein N-acetyltransferase